MGKWAVVIAIVLLSVLLTVAIVAAAQAACPRRGRRVREWWDAARPALLALLLVGGFVCGTIGEYRRSATERAVAAEAQTLPEAARSDAAQEPFSLPGQATILADAAYGGFLEVVLAGRFTPVTSNWTRLARLAGLGAAFLIAWEAIRRLFAKPIRNLTLKSYRGHVILFGLGRVGAALARDLTQGAQGRGRRRAVVAIELSPSAPYLREAERAGVLVIEGNASDGELHRLVGIERAETVCIATGSDEANLEVEQMIVARMARMDAVYRKRGGRLARFLGRAAPRWPRILVHLKNRRLSAMLNMSNQAEPGSVADGSAEARRDIGRKVVDEVVGFNLVDRSIERLLNGPVLERRPRAPEEVLHAVIVGFGEVGQALARFLGDLAHYENHRRSRMTILYEESEAPAVAAFQARYPQFFPSVNDPAVADLLNREGQEAMPFDAWMPPAEMDEWSFGVQVEKGTDANGKKVVLADGGRGCTYAVNGGFVKQAGGCVVRAVVDRVIVLCRSKGVRPMVFLCQDRDEENCVDAKHLRDELDVHLKEAKQDGTKGYQDQDHRVTVFPYVPFRPSLYTIVDPGDKNSADLIPWGGTREVCTYDSLRSDLVYDLAVSAHADFKANAEEAIASPQKRSPRFASANDIQAFEKSAPWERHSNLMAAAHWNAKLATVNLKLLSDPDLNGAEPVEASELLKVTDDQKDLMAQMEHNRWLAERLIQNWKFGARSEKRDPENCRRTTMVNWLNIVGWEKQKDYLQIEGLIKFCQHEMVRPPDERRLRLARLK